MMRSSRTRHVVFLLGAGISFDVLPLSRRVAEIVRTAKAPDDREVVRFSDATYGLVNAADADERGRADVERVTYFLNWLVRRFPDDEMDYEGLFFACKQIHDVIMGEAENPILTPFIAECEAHAFAMQPGPLGPRYHLGELAREALNYIGAIVRETLTLSSDSAVDPNQLRAAYRLLLDAAADNEVVRLDLVTLNHDTLLERSFRNAGFAVEDGFAKPTAGFQLADGGLVGVEFWRGFRRRRGPIRLIKLHGSIDWWRVRPVGGDLSQEDVARVDIYPQRLHDATGVSWEAPDATPLILVGTFNKILEYARPFHLQHYAVMRRALLKSDALVIAGYSFRDKAVNGMITAWYYAKDWRRLAVIGPRLRSDEPPATARGAIAHKWLDWCSSGRMTVLTARFSDTDWHSVRVALVSPRATAVGTSS